jgi:hypothetical protein
VKIAVFYHVKFDGPDINRGHAESIFREQMALFANGGLYANADKIFLGINGGLESFGTAEKLLPRGADAEFVYHGSQSRSELPTLLALQKWLPSGEDWAVCYWHAKGATRPGHELSRVWRRCMETATIRQWERCVSDLGKADTVGAHWLCNETHAAIGPWAAESVEACRDVVDWPILKPKATPRFWGGNFWWANASFLRKLPPLASNSLCRHHDFLAEIWIGEGPAPRVVDYAPHWPGVATCGPFVKE